MPKFKPIKTLEDAIEAISALLHFIRSQPPRCLEIKTKLPIQPFPKKAQTGTKKGKK